MVVGLNPSTADECTDDPTARRCLGFARSWGFGHLVLTNLFALRTTDPTRLRDAVDPVGPENDVHLSACAGEADAILAAWGAAGALHGRDGAVCHMLRDRELLCLGRTVSCQPRHPLYVAADRKAEVYRPHDPVEGTAHLLTFTRGRAGQRIRKGDRVRVRLAGDDPLVQGTPGRMRALLQLDDAERGLVQPAE